MLHTETTGSRPAGLGSWPATQILCVSLSGMTAVVRSSVACTKCDPQRCCRYQAGVCAAVATQPAHVRGGAAHRSGLAALDLYAWQCWGPECMASAALLASMGATQVYVCMCAIDVLGESYTTSGQAEGHLRLGIQLQASQSVTSACEGLPGVASALLAGQRCWAAGQRWCTVLPWLTGLGVISPQPTRGGSNAGRQQLLAQARDSLPTDPRVRHCWQAVAASLRR